MRQPALAAALVATLAAGTAAAEIDLEVVARDTVRELVDGKYDAVVGRFAPELRKTLGRDQIALLVDPLRAERSPAKSVIARLRRDEPDGLVQFTVKAYWARVATSDFKLRLRADGTIVSLSVGDEVKPEDDAARDRYEPRARLRLPMRGTVVVRNAARDGSNPHFAVRSQRHAIDLVVERAGGKTFRGGGAANEDYGAWGLDVLAPADGKIALVIDGIPDNRPGQRDPFFAPGNLVAIDLGGGEFVLLGHLQAGSIVVKVGQSVRAGEAVAKVGSSGATSEPMLHFQLADKPRLAEAASLPLRLDGVTVDGKKAAKPAAPAEGQRLAAE